MSYQGQQPLSVINQNTGNEMHYRSVAVEGQQLTRPKTAVLNIPQPVLNNLFQRSKTCYTLGAHKNEEFNNYGTTTTTTTTTTKSSIPQDLSCFDVKQANKAIYNHDLMNHLLLRRFKQVHSRPKYSVRIDMDKLKPDPAAEVTRVNAAQTYFYNTIPAKKASFTIDPNFASESILDYRRSKSCNNLTKFRRDYAFVY